MDSSGIGGPTESTGPDKIPSGPSEGALENALHTPVKTLGDLKRVLISSMGEKEGTKFYNNFLKSFAMLMLNQVQHAASAAKKASRQMRMDR